MDFVTIIHLKPLPNSFIVKKLGLHVWLYRKKTYFNGLAQHMLYGTVVNSARKLRHDPSKLTNPKIKPFQHFN